MDSSLPSLLSTRTTLAATLVAASLALTLGVVACSDGVAPSTSSEMPTATESSSSAPAKDEEVFMVVENPPELVGGMSALQESISYPEMAKEAGIEGRVIIQFIVDQDGNVTNPKVTRGVHEMLDQAALDAVKEQTFRPGKQEGQSVPVQMSLPVTFRLDGGPRDESDESSATSETNSGGLLFEKAGIQVVRVLMNAEGDLLLDDEQVKAPNLTDAVRQRITKDAARAVLLHDDAAPTDRVAAAKSNLSALDLQEVYIKRVE
jgi:TonB family protein